jgi:uncharacterized protein (TIGR00730 family)
MNIAVFCGASLPADPRILDAGRALGRLFAEKKIGMVYGGASIGLMGATADACLAAGGMVIGVMPQVLIDAEVGHRSLTRLEVVPDLHTRKARMAELSDGFAVLPGGLGTLDELFDILTWRTLGLHQKPVALLDTHSFWQPLQTLMRHLVQQGLVKPANAALLLHCPTPEALVEALTRGR